MKTACAIFFIFVATTFAATTFATTLREEHWLGEKSGEENLPHFPARILTWRDGVLTWKSLAISENSPINDAQEIFSSTQVNSLLLEVPRDEKLARAWWEEITLVNNAPQTIFLRNGDQMRGVLHEIDATHILFHIDGNSRPTSILRHRIRGISGLHR